MGDDFFLFFVFLFLFFWLVGCFLDNIAENGPEFTS